jgi:hypothetical protein
MSKLVREGVMSRDEALKNLDMNFSDKLLDGILGELDLTQKDIR